MRLRTQARFELEAARDMVRSERVEAIVEEATAPAPEAKEGEKKVADADAEVCPMCAAVLVAWERSVVS